MTFDKGVIAALGSLAFQQLQQAGGDLEAFAKHAKRTTVQTEDVKLFVRRNKGVVEHISEIAEGFASKAAEKKRKKTVKSSDSSEQQPSKKAKKTVTAKTPFIE